MMFDDNIQNLWIFRIILSTRTCSNSLYSRSYDGYKPRAVPLLSPILATLREVMCKYLYMYIFATAVSPSVVVQS